MRRATGLRREGGAGSWLPMQPGGVSSIPRMGD